MIGLIAKRRFDQYPELAETLLETLDLNDDAAHDLAHLGRVWKLVLDIQAAEGGNLEILLAATILHDSVFIEKNHPDRSQASRMAAKKAAAVLAEIGWQEDRINQVEHVIAAHSYSAGIIPESIEAMILQDADRLDAIGAIGIARCFYISGRMHTSLYDWDDPDANHRPLNDLEFALDHFAIKLIPLADKLLTAKGRQLAEERKTTMVNFVEMMIAEAK